MAFDLETETFFSGQFHRHRKIWDIWSRPGVNFINILRAAFACADPKSTKRTYNLTVFLGSARVKAARIMFVKLTPGIYFWKIRDQRPRNRWRQKKHKRIFEKLFKSNPILCWPTVSWSVEKIDWFLFGWFQNFWLSSSCAKHE